MTFAEKIKSFIFVSRGREVDYLARLITLKPLVRIQPNATKNPIKGFVVTNQMCAAASGLGVKSEYLTKNGSCDRLIIATADGNFERKAQTIGGLFSFKAIRP